MQVFFAAVAPILCFGVATAREQGGKGEAASAYSQYMRQGADPDAGYHKFMNLYAQENIEKIDRSKGQYHTYIKQHALNSDDQPGKGYQQYMGEYTTNYKTFMDKSDRTQEVASGSKVVDVEALPRTAPQGLAARPAEPQQQQQRASKEYRGSDYRTYMLDGRGQEASAGYRKYLATYMERLMPGSKTTLASQQALIARASTKYPNFYIAVPVLMLLTMAIATAAKVSRPQYWRRHRSADSKTEALLATEA